MKTTGSVVAVVAVTLLFSAAARAAHVDFKDPRRALGREDNIKVDAEMAQETLSAGNPVCVTYQVENLTSLPIAIADKIAVASFDADSHTITLTIGAEVPPGETMPHLTIIAPGQKRAFRASAIAQVAFANTSGPWAPTPRFVLIVVDVLRDIRPFANLIATQVRSNIAPRLPNDLFDQWVSSVSTVELNILPIRWSAQQGSSTAEASRPSRSGSF